jgi:ribonuclease P protein component
VPGVGHARFGFRHSLFGFPKAIRLRKSPEFVAVQRRGRRVKGSLFVGVVLPRDEGPARFGLAVSRKVGNAVVRNRVKRRVREAIRQFRVTLGLDRVDVVIIGLPEAAGAGSAAIRLEVERICKAARAPAVRAEGRG